MRIIPEFEEVVKIFDKALCKHGPCLDSVLTAMSEIAGRERPGVSAIHALAISLSKLPSEQLGFLGYETQERMRELCHHVEEWTETIRRTLEARLKDESAKIDTETRIDCTYYDPLHWYLRIAKLEATLVALRWVYEPPSEEEQRLRI